MKTSNKRVTTGKHNGDDNYSYAVFLDNKPVVTGLSKPELPYYANQIINKIK